MNKMLKTILKVSASIIALLVVVFIVFIIIIGLSLTSEPNIEFKENIQAVSWLPPVATNITYYNQDGFATVKQYVCSIPVDSFKSFAKKEGWVLEEKTKIRLNKMYFLHKKTDLDFSKEIEQALVYEKRFSNGGGTTVVYDKISNKLYFSYNHN